MKRTVIVLILLISAMLPAYAVPQMMEAAGVGQGRLTIMPFYKQFYQRGDDEISNGYVIRVTSNPYLFESAGFGLRMTYGLLDSLDLYISYLGDQTEDRYNIEPFDVPSTVSIDRIVQLSGGAPSIGLKYNFLNSPFDMALYLDYEPAAYKFEYRFTNWGVMPPAGGSFEFDYTRTTFSAGLLMSGRLGVLTPYVGVGCSSIAVEETMDNFDYHVNGTSVSFNYGFRWRMIGELSLYADQAVDNQVWEEGSDRTGSVVVDPAHGQTVINSVGLMLVF